MNGAFWPGARAAARDVGAALVPHAGGRPAGVPWRVLARRVPHVGVDRRVPGPSARPRSARWCAPGMYAGPTRPIGTLAGLATCGSGPARTWTTSAAPIRLRVRPQNVEGISDLLGTLMGSALSSTFTPPNTQRLTVFFLLL